MLASAMQTITSHSAEMTQVFKTQCLTFQEGYTMLEDFCIKCLKQEIPIREIVLGVGEFYRQAAEVAVENIDRARDYLDNKINAPETPEQE